MKLLEEGGFLLFHEYQPRSVIYLWLAVSSFVQGIFVWELAIILSSKDPSSNLVVLIVVCNIVPLLVFCMSLVNLRTQPYLKIYEDRLIITNFGKTTVILIEDIKFLRKFGAHFDVVMHSNDRCLCPALPSARFARELLEDLIGSELTDREFEGRRSSIIAWIIVVGMTLPFLLILILKIVG